jgi:hypothetical protein
MEDDYDSYNYDKSLFFSLLQTTRHKLKYEFVQHKQGLVVCPLKMSNTLLSKFEAELIDRHLFIPSPFYKNHYVPLVSLSSLSMLNNSSPLLYTQSLQVSSSSSSPGSVLLFNSVPLDHSQHITLILVDESSHLGAKNASKVEMLLISGGHKRICKNVKLLSIQTAYNQTLQAYKILIVNRPLQYKQSSKYKSNMLTQHRIQQILSNRLNNENEYETDYPSSNGRNESYDENEEADEDRSRLGEEDSQEVDDLDYYDENEAMLRLGGRRATMMSPTPNGLPTIYLNDRRRSMNSFGLMGAKSSSPFAVGASVAVNSFNTLNDVRTFGQSIDFMHDMVGFVQMNDEQDDLEITDSEGEEEKRPSSNKSSNNRVGANGTWSSESSTKRKLSSLLFVNEKKPYRQFLIGESLLAEIELFRKTYIVLSSHMSDCVSYLYRLYKKYVKLFMKSYKMFASQNQVDNIDDIDQMVSVACEIVINGCLFAKLWSSVQQMNSSKDAYLLLRCMQLKNYLKLDELAIATVIDTKNSKSVAKHDCLRACSKYFQLDADYFRINCKPIIRELSRLALMNNPFEKLECIKTSVDLLTNEVNILFTATLNKSEEKNVTPGSNVITTELLIPLLSFIIIKTEIDCLQSIVYFIENFHFSYRQSSFSNSFNSAHLAELNFFFVTFKAAIQLIESSNLLI